MPFIKRAIVPIVVEDKEEVLDWGKGNDEEDVDLMTHRRLAMAKLAVKQTKLVKPSVQPRVAPKADPNSEK
jgi:hypothetical protein